MLLLVLPSVQREPLKPAILQNNTPSLQLAAGAPEVPLGTFFNCILQAQERTLSFGICGIPASSHDDSTNGFRQSLCRLSSRKIPARESHDEYVDLFVTRIVEVAGEDGASEPGCLLRVRDFLDLGFEVELAGCWCQANAKQSFCVSGIQESIGLYCMR